MRKQITKVRAPNHFTFKIKEYSSRETIYVYLVNKKKKNKKVGEVRLYHQGDGIYETHSDLDEEYRGRGFGARLYARAIQWCLENNFRVRSTGSSSSYAQRMWRGKTIRKYFRIVTKKYKGNPVPENDTWHAYAKLK